MCKKKKTGQKAFCSTGSMLLLILLTFILSACTQSMYSVDMRYEPTAALNPDNTGNGKGGLTVAVFEDLRASQDKIKIGHVITVGGKSIPVAPKYKTPQDVVTLGFKEYFSKSGFTVSGGKPGWDLREASIQPGWGSVVVGGTIDELEVLCRDEFPIKKYRTTVKLTVVFADVEKKQVLFRTSTQSTASLEHVLFSEKRMQDLLNETLSDAIAKVFEEGKMERKILDAMKKK